MQNTISQWLSQISVQLTRSALDRLFKTTSRATSCVALSSAGLVIKAGGGVLAKTGGAAFYASVNGTLVTVAAGVDMPALTGLNISANAFNVACFFINGSGTVSARFGVEGSAIGRVKWPDFPDDQALVGALLITHSSAFTGNTTALDTATTVYLSPVGAVDPTFIYA
jgi:hypothetical protein